MSTPRTYTAFLNDRRVVSGAMTDVLLRLAEQPDGRRALVFDDADGELVPLARPGATRGTTSGVGHTVRTAPETIQVTLLPRHLAWLEAQPGGPSAAIRRLVETARKDGTGRPRQARDAAYRFVSMVAGDLPGFEEACRALYAGDVARFVTAAEDWPADLRGYACRLASDGWAQAA